jgi:hypothetical protein
MTTSLNNQAKDEIQEYPKFSLQIREYNMTWFKDQEALMYFILEIKSQKTPI